MERFMRTVITQHYFNHLVRFWCFSKMVAGRRAEPKEKGRPVAGPPLSVTSVRSGPAIP
jgi:hypothetical protein